jgi:hypothetical protein
MTEYDFILHLNPKHASRLAESIAANEESKIAKLWEGHVRNQAVSGMAAQSIRADFDPVASFHGDLQASFFILLTFAKLYSPSRVHSDFMESKPSSSTTNMVGKL